MIKLVLKDRKPFVPITYTPPPSPWKAPAQPSVSNITVYNETRRRDNIIKKLVEDCGFVEGQVVLSAVKEEEHVINKICKCYAHMGADVDWPTNDNPMIMTITKVKDKTISFCTTNYLKAKV